MMSLVSVLGCGTWFFLIEEQLYWEADLALDDELDDGTELYGINFDYIL